ncbi:hypothetical protein FDO65_19580 [Nakamurella flava]|uniref:Uncharacterized protein n=1 Tax=Nakamurella flava TaxID=2576308 RepID=A0A4U6QAV5_9ACTN|nr:hypothetical protein [Nakamurella flava]TKV57016.1 hypothetical protein FDO65_19580 [Nakamurella flava]
MQGDASEHGDELLTDRTSAPAAYVGLTRGQKSNTLHIVARTVDDAREQWVTAAGRGRPDLCLANAQAVAAGEAADYATQEQEPTVSVVDDRAAKKPRSRPEQENQPRPGEPGGRQLTPAERLARVRTQSATRFAGRAGRRTTPVDRRERETVADTTHEEDTIDLVDDDNPRQQYRGHGPRR